MALLHKEEQIATIHERTDSKNFNTKNLRFVAARV